MPETKKLDRSDVEDAFVDSIAGVLHAARDLGFTAEETADIITKAVQAVDTERAITANGRCSKCETIVLAESCSNCGHSKEQHNLDEEPGCWEGAPYGDRCACREWKS